MIKKMVKQIKQWLVKLDNARIFNGWKINFKYLSPDRLEHRSEKTKDDTFFHYRTDFPKNKNH